MGKTPKPLTILVLSHEMVEWEEIKVLQEKGHTVGTLLDVKLGHTAFENPDLVLGPTCWRMTPQHRKYLLLAIAVARKQRYSDGG